MPLKYLAGFGHLSSPPPQHSQQNTVEKRSPSRRGTSLTCPRVGGGRFSVWRGRLGLRDAFLDVGRSAKIRGMLAWQPCAGGKIPYCLARLTSGRSIRQGLFAWLLTSPTGKVLGPMKNLLQGFVAVSFIGLILANHSRKDAAAAPEAPAHVPMAFRDSLASLRVHAEPMQDYAIQNNHMAIYVHIWL